MSPSLTYQAQEAREHWLSVMDHLARPQPTEPDHTNGSGA